MVEDSMISWTYWDKDCQTGGNKLTSEGLGYTMNMTRATSELGDGSGTRAYQLSLNPNADVKDNTDIYIGDLQDGGNNWYGSLTLCARASLSTENDVEVNFIENVITVRYEFTDGFFTIDDVKVDRPVGKFCFALFYFILFCIVSYRIVCIVLFCFVLYRYTSISVASHYMLIGFDLITKTNTVLSCFDSINSFQFNSFQFNSIFIFYF